MFKYSLVMLLVSVSSYACPDLSGMYSRCTSKDLLAQGSLPESVSIQQKKVNHYTVVRIEEVNKSDRKKSSLTIPTNGQKVTAVISSELGKIKAVLQAKCSVKNGAGYLNVVSTAKLPGSEIEIKELSRYSKSKKGELIIEKFADFGDGAKWVPVFEDGPIVCRK